MSSSRTMFKFVETDKIRRENRLDEVVKIYELLNLLELFGLDEIDETVKIEIINDLNDSVKQMLYSKLNEITMTE